MKDMEDILELIDEDYGTVSEEKKPRQIKTRAVSFGRIANAWRKFRISRNEKKLAKAKEKALTDSYNIKTVSQLDKAEKKVWLYRTGSRAEPRKAQMQIQAHGADREKSRKSGSP